MILTEKVVEESFEDSQVKPIDIEKIPKIPPVVIGRSKNPSEACR